jgi:sugar-specific transcriptional regulator TrmB
MNIDPLLKLFELRPIEQKVYEALLASGELGASELATRANISRTSVYDLLKHLIDKGLVYETVAGGIKKFGPQPPDKVRLLLEEHGREIDRAKKHIDNLNIAYQKAAQKAGPRVQLFEGRQALQQMMKDLLLYRDITVQAYWPVMRVVELLTPSFIKKFNEDRISQNIRIEVLWPKGQTPPFRKYPHLSPGKGFMRDARILPENFDFSLGYTIYGDTVRFISSGKESFGYIIESAEFAEMMRSQFKLIWNISKPLM